MRATIEVKDRREADAIRLGLADPMLRAVVVIVGTLQQLPSKRAQHRVMEYVTDKLSEELEDGQGDEGSNHRPPVA